MKLYKGASVPAQEPIADASPVPDPQEMQMPATKQQMPNEQMPEQPVDEPEQKQEEEGGKEGIQKMAGELSQLIRDYNSEMPEPDAETNKFAAGMVVAAAIKDLDEKDRKDILKKLKAGEFDEEKAAEEIPEEPVAEMPVPEIPMESKRYSKKQIEESLKK